MKTLAMVGQTAGLVGLLAAQAFGAKLIGVVAYDDIPRAAIPTRVPIYARLVGVPDDAHWDLLLCVHGREIVPDEFLARARWASINVRPFRGKYNGANPVERALEAREQVGWVEAHEMTCRVDEGPLVARAETLLRHDGFALTVSRVYHQLYPLYARVVRDVATRGRRAYP